MGLLIFAIGMIGSCISLILLIIKAIKRKPVKPALIALIICLILFVVGVLIPTDTTEQAPAETEAPTSQTEEPVQENKPIYADAQIVDLMNGPGTEKVGTFTLTKAAKADCTDEALADWYFNYVKSNPDSNFHIIVYTDVAGKGVYANKGFIQKDVSLNEENNGKYTLGDDAGSTYYAANEDSKTISVQFTMADETVVNNAKAKIDELIPESYKNGKLYAVDVAGEEGELDCNLTLISAEFETADLQSIAVELATKVKGLNLGIGYFCIAFQTDDYTLTALSSLDNLATQEAAEISTKAF